MPSLYPLRFEPVFRRYLWGGRRLESVLAKRLPPGDDFAESWELVDHGADQSVVAAGPLSGRTLAELVADHGTELFGRHAPQNQFPLLFKFLDCNRTLSVQVHPNDVQAARQTPPDLGKTEAWIVLHAEPGSVIYAGLKRGFDRRAFEREIHRGTAELCLHKFAPRAGDCVLIPAGVVHALGQGLVVAEIQQASDTTFRLFDWNRVGPDGKPRALHVEQGLAVLDFAAGPVDPLPPRPLEPGVARLVECEKFVVDRHELAAPRAIGGEERFHILSVIEGELDVAGDPANRPLRRGETLLLPAVCGAVACTPRGSAVVLDMGLPVVSRS